MDKYYIFSCIDALFSLVQGAFLPIAIAYLAKFYKKHDFGFKLILQLILRFFLIFLFYSVIMVTMYGLSEVFFSGRGLTTWVPGFIYPYWAIPYQYIAFGLGLFIGIILLIIGFRRGKRRTAKI